MANIGLRNAKYNLLDYETNKYKTLANNVVPTIGKLIDAQLTEDTNDTSLFADDALAEYDNTFKGGSLKITLADVNDRTYAELKGCVISEGEITENDENTSPEIGYGHIVTKMVNGQRQYKVEFLPRLRVTKITGDAKTKGENIEFGTVSLEGKVMPLKDSFNGLQRGDWKKIKTFETVSEAQEYLDSLLTPVTSS